MKEIKIELEFVKQVQEQKKFLILEIIKAHDQIKANRPERPSREIFEFICRKLSEQTPVLWIYTPVQNTIDIFIKGSLN